MARKKHSEAVITIKERGVDKTVLAIANVGKQVKKNTRYLKKSTKAVQQNTKAFRKLSSGMGQMKFAAMASNARLLFSVLKQGITILRSGAEAGDAWINFLSRQKTAYIDLAAVSKALRGTIDETTLLQILNKAQLLKVEVSTLPQLAQMAANISAVTAQKTADVFQALITGVTTGRTGTLKMMGVLVDATIANKEYAQSLQKSTAELTIREKQLALINNILKNNTELLRKNITSNVQQIDTLGTKITNFWSDLKEIASAHVFGARSNLGVGISDQIDRMEKLSEKTETYKTTALYGFGLLGVAINLLRDDTNVYTDALEKLRLKFNEIGQGELVTLKQGQGILNKLLGRFAQTITMDAIPRLQEIQKELWKKQTRLRGVRDDLLETNKSLGIFGDQIRKNRIELAKTNRTLEATEKRIKKLIGLQQRRNFLDKKGVAEVGREKEKQKAGMRVQRRRGGRRPKFGKSGLDALSLQMLRQIGTPDPSTLAENYVDQFYQTILTRQTTTGKGRGDKKSPVASTLLPIAGAKVREEVKMGGTDTLQVGDEAARGFSATLKELASTSDGTTESLLRLAGGFEGVVAAFEKGAPMGIAAAAKLTKGLIKNDKVYAAFQIGQQLAMAFATLFTNPPQSAAHFVSAALFSAQAIKSAISGGGAKVGSSTSPAKYSAAELGGRRRDKGKIINYNITFNAPIDPVSTGRMIVDTANAAHAVDGSVQFSGNMVQEQGLSGF